MFVIWCYFYYKKTKNVTKMLGFFIYLFIFAVYRKGTGNDYTWQNGFQSFLLGDFLLIGQNICGWY